MISDNPIFLLRSFLLHSLIALLFLVTCVDTAFAQEPDALSEKLEKAIRGLESGYLLLGDKRIVSLEANSQKRIQSQLYKDGCYRFVAVQDKGVGSFSLKVLSGKKTLVKSKKSSPTHVLSYCAEQEAQVDILFSSKSGGGSILFGLFAKGGNSLSIRSKEQKARQALKQLAAQNSAVPLPQKEVFSGHLDQKGKATEKINVETSLCYRFIAATGTGIVDSNLSIIFDGAEVVADRLSGINPAVKGCAPKSGEVTAELSLYGGAGAYALGVYVEDGKSKKAPEKVGGLGSDFIANRLQQLHTQFGKGRAAVSGVFRGNLSEKNKGSHQISLLGGHCYTAIAVGMPSVKDLDLSFYDPNNNRVAFDTTQNSYPILDTNPCVEKDSVYTVRVTMTKGRGPYGFQVFSD